MSEEREPQAPDRGAPPDSGEAGDAQGARRRRGPRRAVRRGGESETVLGVGADERSDVGSNDDRLRQDVPPHW